MVSMHLAYVVQRSCECSDFTALRLGWQVNMDEILCLQCIASGAGAVVQCNEGMQRRENGSALTCPPCGVVHGH